MLVCPDTQLAPALAGWMRQALGVDAQVVRDLGLRDAEHRAVFVQARTAGAVLLTQDRCFMDLLERHGLPPQVV